VIQVLEGKENLSGFTDKLRLEKDAELSLKNNMMVDEIEQLMNEIKENR
jgi:hypothetical protein